MYHFFVLIDLSCSLARILYLNERNNFLFVYHMAIWNRPISQPHVQTFSSFLWLFIFKNENMVYFKIWNEKCEKIVRRMKSQLKWILLFFFLYHSLANFPPLTRPSSEDTSELAGMRHDGVTCIAVPLITTSAVCLSTILSTAVTVWGPETDYS